jgi:hypothetical protein
VDTKQHKLVLKDQDKQRSNEDVEADSSSSSSSSTSTSSTSSSSSLTTSQQQQLYQYRLQLLVPPGQLELGRRLITAMYSSSPDLSDLEGTQLLQLVALAECYEVNKVITAVAAQLRQLTVDTMSLGTAVAVLQLPEACLGLKAFQRVQETAADKLQQDLGDLEVVWGDTNKQQTLFGLPLMVLGVLLSDERTRVAAEDTAVYTAYRWLEENATTGTQQQQLQLRQQLMGSLRLPHCTATYLAGAGAPAGSWLRGAGLTEAEALSLCTLPPPGTPQHAMHLRKMHPNRAAWELPARPVSSVKEGVVRWQMPLSELEEVVHRDTKAFWFRPMGAVVTWCGRSWGMEVLGAGADLGLYLWSKQEPADFAGTYTIEAISDAVLPVKRSMTGGFVKGNMDGLGFPRMLVWGADKDWTQVKEEI